MIVLLTEYNYITLSLENQSQLAFHMQSLGLLFLFMVALCMFVVFRAEQHTVCAVSTSLQSELWEQLSPVYQPTHH